MYSIWTQRSGWAGFYDAKSLRRAVGKSLRLFVKCGKCVFEYPAVQRDRFASLTLHGQQSGSSGRQCRLLGPDGQGRILVDKLLAEAEKPAQSFMDSRFCPRINLIQLMGEFLDRKHRLFGQAIEGREPLGTQPIILNRHFLALSCAYRCSCLRSGVCLDYGGLEYPVPATESQHACKEGLIVMKGVVFAPPQRDQISQSVARLRSTQGKLPEAVCLQKAQNCCDQRPDHDYPEHPWDCLTFWFHRRFFAGNFKVQL